MTTRCGRPHDAADERSIVERAAAAGSDRRRRMDRSFTPTWPLRLSSSLSLRVMQRQRLKDIMPFGSPVLALVDEVRRRGASVSEYRVDVGSPRIGAERIVDVFATPLGDEQRRRRDHAAGAHDRRQDGSAAHASRGGPLDHGARRHAGPRDQEPAVRHPGRGAAARAIGQRGRPDADPADLRRGGPDRASGRAHGAVRRRAAGRAGAGQRSWGARPREAARAIGLRPAHPVRRELRPVAAAGARQPRTSCPGDPEPGQECRRSDRDDAFDGEIVLCTAFRTGVRLQVPGSRERVSLPIELGVRDNGPGVPPTSCRELFDRSSPPRRREVASDLPWWRRSSATTAGSSNAIRLRAERPSASSCRCTRARDGPRSETLRLIACRADRFSLADDDAAIRTVLNQALSRAGYEVRSTSNAATLWRWVRRGRAISSSPTW